MTVPTTDSETPPPFSPSAARAAREVMALSCGRVAARLASYEIRVSPGDVAAWEAGTLAPSEDQLMALATSLAVPVGRLIGDPPATLQARRLAAGFTRHDLARRIGMTEASYTRMERAAAYRGDERRTGALVRELDVSLRDLIGLCGATPRLEQLLAECAADGRWKPRLGDVCELIGLRRKRVQEAFDVLAAHYAAAEPPKEPRDVADRFWWLLDNPAPDVLAPAIWRQSR